ncbi:tRNA lysidine(34) synthetase TilS [Vibrio sp. SS-MA-C1-2]|uniref:tRNA lysidine(34) synthetase TilS n=1 Tax=Vibrio sp. SS-MA-C1-2 TaxID=2908646 RepID=UPI001F20EA11|nr:tRNA lysidine(34) synthetase TilS [Vibrio sp. SS-MA-C1-2]UJF18886.1 tRNA lysidine(34) synthetase TilS [Vibrio sp. SS-MA-C1-2]
MLTTLPNFSTQLSPFQSVPSITIAFSGGVDSRVLLRNVSLWAKENDCLDRVNAVYIHHGLSVNSEIWAEKCQLWAEDEGIICYVERVDVSQDKGVSVEQEARNARYQALTPYVKPGGILVTGQHADDQVETFILALKRGSGPAGLASMPYQLSFAEGQIIRPLLTYSRQEIEVYAQQHRLQWVEDESNQDNKYDRNFLRNTLIPQFVDRWPGWKKAVNRTAKLCGEQEHLLNELTADKLQQAIFKDGSLQIDSLVRLSDALSRRLVRDWIKQKKQLENSNITLPSEAQLQQIFHSVIDAKPDANPQVCWGDIQVRRYQNRLYIVENLPSIEDLVIDIQLDKWVRLPENLGEIRLQHRPFGDGNLRLPIELNEETQTALSPITIRFNGSGIAIKPVGRQGKRKLKKLYQEYGVPSWLRKRTPLLFYGENLVSVADLFENSAFVGLDCQLYWRRTICDTKE